MKESAQGERITAEIAQCNPITGDIEHSEEEMLRLLDVAIDHAEMRMADCNFRMLEAYGFQQYFSVEVWQRVKTILDVLAGRITAASVVNMWQASIEETQELERLRADAQLEAQFLYENGDDTAQER